MTAAWQRSIDAVFRFPPSLSRRDTFVQSVCVCVCVCVCVGGGGGGGARGDGLLSAESFSQSAAGNGA